MSDPARAHLGGGDELATELRRLADRIDTLQADVRRLSAPTLPAGPGWDEDEEAEQRGVSHDWLGALEPTIRTRPQVPRLLVEGLFLAACAVGAALAELDGVAIFGVMLGAWLLVALIEWAASRAERTRDELLSAPPPVPVVAAAEADPSWFVPPVERTMLDAGQATGSVTAATRLPAAPPSDVEATAERPPPTD